MNKFHKIPIEKKKKMPEGEAYPIVFPQLVRSMSFDQPLSAKENTFDNYFKSCSLYNKNFKAEFNLGDRG